MGSLHEEIMESMKYEIYEVHGSAVEKSTFEKVDGGPPFSCVYFFDTL